MEIKLNLDKAEKNRHLKNKMFLISTKDLENNIYYDIRTDINELFSYLEHFYNNYWFGDITISVIKKHN